MKWQSIFGASTLLFVALSSALAESPQGHVVDRQITSTNFFANKVGISPVRKMAIYLPPGYDVSLRRYPVIYFLPNPFEDGYRFVLIIEMSRAPLIEPLRMA